MGPANQNISFAREVYREGGTARISIYHAYHVRVVIIMRIIAPRIGYCKEARSIHISQCMMNGSPKKVMTHNMLHTLLKFWDHYYHYIYTCKYKYSDTDPSPSFIYYMSQQRGPGPISEPSARWSLNYSQRELPEKVIVFLMICCKENKKNSYKDIQTSWQGYK